MSNLTRLGRALVCAALTLACGQGVELDSPPLPPSPPEPEPPWVFSHTIEVPDVEGECWLFVVHGTRDVALRAPELGCELPSYVCGDVGGVVVEVWERPWHESAWRSVYLESCSR